MKIQNLRSGAALFTLGAFLTPGNASELVIGTPALDVLVRSALFNDQGRWFFQRGKCYAFLEYPVVSLESGRLILDAHLSSRLGAELLDSCVGPGFASQVRISGSLISSGSSLTLDDVKIDRIDDGATAFALSLIRSVGGSALPNAVTIDVFKLLRPTNIAGSNVEVKTTSLKILDVTTAPDAVVVHFDIKLDAR